MNHRGAATTASRQISRRLAERIGHHAYDMWFGDATRLQIEGSCVRVDADCRFVADWIDLHFRKELDGAARETLGDEARVDLRVAADRAGPPAGADEEAGKAARRAAARRPSPKISRLRRLEDFVVGSSNALAVTAATRLAEGSGEGSPLLVHGACGVGKTHLLQGVTQRFAERASPRGRFAARYVTAEQFTNEYITAVRANRLDSFRHRTRKLALLAIDDVHFLSNKTATQKEFLHTIDAMALAGSRVVLASDVHPRHLHIDQALGSRLLAGMVAEIGQPDRGTRVELARRMAAGRGLSLGDAAAEAIAGRCSGSVREIEGALNKLAALRVLEDGGGGEVGLVLVESAFADGSWRPAAPIRLDTVINVVCDRLAVDTTELCGSGRSRKVVAARGLVAYLGRSLTTMSYPEIARALGRTHHSTIHTAVQRVGRQLEEGRRVETAEAGESPTIGELVNRLRNDILAAARRQSPVQAQPGRSRRSVRPAFQVHYGPHASVPPRAASVSRSRAALALCGAGG